MGRRRLALGQSGNASFGRHRCKRRRAHKVGSIDCSTNSSKTFLLWRRVSPVGGNITWTRSRLRVEVAGRHPLWGTSRLCSVDPRANRATTAVELVGTSNKSECTRELEMPGACLAFFHTAGAGGETDSTMRKCVPQPSAIAPARCHVSYCAWPAEARFDGHAKRSECTRRRRLGLLATCPGDNAADHAALGATECHRAKVTPGLNRDSWLRSV